MVLSLLKTVALLTAASRSVALTLDVTSTDSIKNASSTIAKSIGDLYNNYQGTATTADQVGLFGTPYYWWESAAVWAALIDYAKVTGDTTYNTNLTRALVAQSGNQSDYQPIAQTKDLGNGDQAMWALACMDALEYGYASPSNVTWLELATNVFNTQVARWDNATCNGGMRWQIFSFNVGYSYKNVESNGALFQLSARLARYTGNQTYVDWANRSYDWMQQIGLISSDGHVYDGTDSTTNCSSIDHVEWTSNSGLLVYGSAIMYNTTQSDTWRSRTQALVSTGSQLFFANNTQIMTEEACESVGNCNTDQLAFKSLYARYLAKSTIVAPFLGQSIDGLLKASASAAASTCGNGTECQSIWYSDDVSSSLSVAGGLGQQVSSLSVIQSLLIIDNSSNVQPYTQSSAPSNSSGTTSGGSTNTSSGTSSGTPASQTGAAAQCLPGTVIGIAVMICLTTLVL